MKTKRLILWCSLTMVFLLAGQTLAQTEGKIVTVSVSGGTIPTFSWTPDSSIGRLIVEEGDKEVWDTETDGENSYQSSIRYGVHPPDAAEDLPALPLKAGHTYKVSLFRWLSARPERFQLKGVAEFTSVKAEEDEEEDEEPVRIRPSLEVAELPPEFQLDGILAESAWSDADAIENLVTIEPEEGGVPEGRTVIKVLANESDIIVGARCYDNEPDKIVSFSKARDSELLGLDASDPEDQILMVFDTFLDGCSGYVFAVNPEALVVNTRQVDSLDVGDVDEDIKIHVPQTTMGALRLSQNILNESSVGMLATFGDQRGHSDSWMAGADFTYRTSEFLNEKNFGISLWGLLNEGKDPDGDDLEGSKSAFGLRIDYPNDLFDISSRTIRIGDGFQPSLGFVPRNDVHVWDFTTEISPRPSWPWLRQMTHELSFTTFNNLDNNPWESYEALIKPIDWLLESGDRFEASFLAQGDRPPEAFEIATDVDVASSAFGGQYDWTRYALIRANGIKKKAATLLQIDPRNFPYLLRKHNLI